MERTVNDRLFDPAPHFGEWLQALEDFRSRPRTESSPGVFLADGDPDFAELLSLDDQLPDEIHSEGTLVVTEYGRLEADVAVTVAVVDGIFKGKITASERVILENHAVVIGDINTPALTIRGGAIIEGQCYFQQLERKEVAPEPEHVILENHPLVAGDINTPALPIRAGAIIEGQCYFEPPTQIEVTPEQWEHPGWQAFKIGFARVWRDRISHQSENFQRLRK